MRDLAVKVLRKTGEIGLTEQPDGPEENAVLEAAQGFYQSWALSQIRTERMVSADGEAREYERVSSTVDVAMTRPATISDPDAEGGWRSPRNGAVIEFALGDPHEIWIFSSLVADWQQIEDLTLDSSAPLAAFGMDGLACAVAEYMGSDAGRELSPQVLKDAARFRMKINAVPQAMEAVFY
jgi:hypothetical protein